MLNQPLYHPVINRKFFISLISIQQPFNSYTQNFTNLFCSFFSSTPCCGLFSLFSYFPHSAGVANLTRERLRYFRSFVIFSFMPLFYTTSFPATAFFLFSFLPFFIILLYFLPAPCWRVSSPHFFSILPLLLGVVFVFWLRCVYLRRFSMRFRVCPKN